MLATENVTKYYGDICAAEDISFKVHEGEFVTLLGPSGCGKSTLLHIIAGLTDATNGEIHIRSENMTNIPPEQRGIGMVFQSTSLFPNMNVGENIKYGMKLHDYDAKNLDERTKNLLEMVQLSGYNDHQPSNLSGGQKQRIALARALAYEPDILLLDEPLTGLDKVLREEMRREIDRIQEEVGVTTLYVTHDQEEALSMSNRVIVLDEGSIVQKGSPYEIYNEPSESFVAEFVGKSTKFTGTINTKSPPVLHAEGIDIEISPSNTERIEGEAIAYIRPEDVVINDTTQQAPNEFPGKVADAEELGNYAEIEVEISSSEKTILAEMSGFSGVKPGDEVICQFSPSDVILL